MKKYCDYEMEEIRLEIAELKNKFKKYPYINIDKGMLRFSKAYRMRDSKLGIDAFCKYFNIGRSLRNDAKFADELFDFYTKVVDIVSIYDYYLIARHISLLNYKSNKYCDEDANIYSYVSSPMCIEYNVDGYAC